ncbi:MAG: 50S ribosomal protein L9 [Parcubacteria group bacterium]
MKVILLKDIKGVGKRFEEKDISDGYANNMLIPKKMAVPISPQNLAMVKQLQTQSEAKKKTEEEIVKEKFLKREEKRLALEKFKQSQK